jgi:hypothetical protein
MRARRQREADGRPALAHGAGFRDLRVIFRFDVSINLPFD